ncbi:MAG: DoxX family protein [Gemmatimonadetes bacterium]|nr:DoxX family protein [Gemmatimonadota bacterium]
MSQATIDGTSRGAARVESSGARRSTAPAILRTGDSIVPFILRLALAVVIFPHGAQKVLGWFGGYGIAGTLGFFGSMGIPLAFGVLALAAEFLGPIGLLTGLLGRVAAFGIACVMVVAIATAHLANGFFMNWSGQQAGEGFEYHLLVIAMSLAIMVAGSGRWSVDRLLTRRGER